MSYLPAENVLLEDIGKRWSVLAIVFFFVIFGGLSMLHAYKRDPLASIPVISSGHGNILRHAGWATYTEGYNKFKEGCFRIRTAKKSQSIIVSPRFLGELGKLPDDVLSFGSSMEETLHSKYTGIGHETPGLPQMIGTVLTPALTRLTPTISEEVIRAMECELPQIKSWEEVSIYSKLLRIVSMASGCIFVGPELCRSEEYLEASINYTVDVMVAVYVINAIPTWLQPIIAPLLPQVRRLKRRIREAECFLGHVISSRRRAAEDSDWEKPDDMLQWMMDSRLSGERGHECLSSLQLRLSFAAIHTTTMVTVNAFYTLAAMPELIPMLREDVHEALIQTGGVLTNASLQNMKKLDSFLKEILRYYPMGASSFNRKVLRPFALSNGQVIPTGVNIEIPSGAINLDDTIHKNPMVFDALRYYNIRESLTAEAKTSGRASSLRANTKAREALNNSQFVSLGTSSLTFGYGRHACPGRWFASNEIKMILVTALMRYEMKLPDGEVARYKNIEFGVMSVPDSKKTLLIRKR